VLPLLILVLALALAAGCGAQTSAHHRAADLAGVKRPMPKPDELPDSAVAAMRLERGKARRVGRFRGRSLWVAPTQKGETCLVDAGDAAVGAACGPTLFGPHELAYTQATNGGPPPRPFTLLRLSGIATPGVRSVVVELSDGSNVVLVPNDDGAFGYDEPTAALADGVVPVALLARDGAARQVDRIDLPRAPLVP